MAFYDLVLQAKESVFLDSNIGQINVCLGSSKKRLIGTAKLQLLLRDCDEESLIQQYNTWFKLLLQALESRDPAHVKSSACDVMTQLITCIHSRKELARDFTSTFLNPLISIHLSSEDSWKKSALVGLVKCLECFPRSGLVFKTKIEQLALTYLDYDDPELRQLSLMLYSLLPTLGGHGSSGVKHTESWSAYTKRLLNSMHAMLNDLYEKAPTDDRVMVSGDLVKLWPEVVGFGKYDQLLNRIGVLRLGLTYMLRCKMSVAVHVPLRSLIMLIHRMLTPTPEQIMVKITQEHKILAARLPLVYIEALSLLTVLIRCTTGHMIPYAGLVNRCLLQVLDVTTLATANKAHLIAKKCARIALYKCMMTWLETVGANSNLDAHTHSLLPHLLGDIKPESTANSISLTPNGSAKSRDRKQKKQKASKTKPEAPNTGSPQSQGYPTLCSHALNTLQKFIAHCGVLVDGKYYKQLHEVLLLIVVSVHTSFPKPYDDIQCRIGLYDVITSLVTHCHHSVAPPTTCVTHLLTIGLQDANCQVRETCKQALVVMECLNHPRAPTLCSPLAPETKTENLPEVITDDVSEMSPVQANSMVYITENVSENMTISNQKQSDFRSELISTTSTPLQPDPHADAEEDMHQTQHIDDTEDMNECIAAPISTQAPSGSLITDDNSFPNATETFSPAPEEEAGDATRLTGQLANQGTFDTEQNGTVVSDNINDTLSGTPDPSASATGSKRKLNDVVDNENGDEQQFKRAALQNAELSDENSDIEAMLQDFVDAQPDDNE